MHIVLMAACFVAGTAAWLRRVCPNDFKWRLCFGTLLFSNGMTVVGMMEKTMPLLSYIFALILINLLCVLSYSDIQSHSVETIYLYILLAGGALYTILSEPSVWLSRLIWFVLLFLILSLVAKKEKSGIGSADVKVIAGLSLYLDFSSLFSVLFFSFGAGLIYGIILIMLKKATSKTALPFIPFLLIGTLAGFLF